MGQDRARRLRANAVTDRVIIPSAHVNAVGLVLSLREVGFDGPITCLQHKVGQETIAGRFPHLCEVRAAAIQVPDELPERLMAWYPDEEMNLLFTDERFLGSFYGDQRFSSVPGAGERLETVTNKRRFYEFVSENRLGLVPITVGNEASPWSQFGDRFRSRVWCTWRGMERLPRGGLIQDSRGLSAWRETVDERRLGAQEWGYQEQLSPAPEHNVSVSGWHDSSVHQFIVTRRRGVANGVGWWIERISDPDNLSRVARDILGALDYDGPFELEFVWDDRGLCFKVIELNPRFWMQHRLIQSLTDHALVRRCLGMSAQDDVDERGPRTWLQTDLALSHPLQTARNGYRSVLAYPTTGSLAALIRRKLLR